MAASWLIMSYFQRQQAGSIAVPWMCQQQNQTLFHTQIWTTRPSLVSEHRQFILTIVDISCSVLAGVCMCISVLLCCVLWLRCRAADWAWREQPWMELESGSVTEEIMLWNSWATQLGFVPAVRKRPETLLYLTVLELMLNTMSMGDGNVVRVRWLKLTF